MGDVVQLDRKRKKPTPKEGLRRVGGKMPDRKVVTFTPNGDGYGMVRCNWELEGRKTPIADWTVENLARGCHAELVVKAAW